MKYVLMFSIMLLIFSGLVAKPFTQGFIIIGEVADLTESKLYLKWNSIYGIQVDSVTTNNGEFYFSGIVDEPQLVTVHTKGYRHSLRFYLENSKIEIKGASLEDAVVHGSTTQDDYYVYLNRVGKIYQAEDSLDAILKKSIGDQKDSLLNLFTASFNDLSNCRIEETKLFIEEHPNSFVSLDELRNITYRLEFEELDKLFNSLSKEVKMSKSGQRRYEQITALANTRIGNVAPNFSLDDMSGKSVSLSELKGKYVLIEFWASWCGPCRHENPNLTRLFSKYKNKGFTILGVSLDTDTTSWQKAVSDDSLSWIQVSDLKAWESYVTKLYGIDGIPANYLINPEGFIIKKNLRGEKLRQKLAELFDSKKG